MQFRLLDSQELVESQCHSSNKHLSAFQMLGTVDGAEETGEYGRLCAFQGLEMGGTCVPKFIAET